MKKEVRNGELANYILTLVIIISLSIFFGPAIALAILGLSLVPVLYIHGVFPPKKGINGWTGEAKSKYYDFRGWDKNIFETDKR